MLFHGKSFEQNVLLETRGYFNGLVSGRMFPYLYVPLLSTLTKYTMVHRSGSCKYTTITKCGNSPYSWTLHMHKLNINIIIRIGNRIRHDRVIQRL